MGLLNKLGIGVGVGPSRNVSRPVGGMPLGSGRSTPGNGAVGAVGATRPPDLQEFTRQSNGLKEFLWNLDGLGRGTMLDLGPAWQTTLSFFIERGFRVTSDDLLRSWKEFMAAEEAHLKDAAAGSDAVDLTPAGRASRFVAENLNYKVSSFDAVLLWDTLDYLEPAVAKQTVGCLTEFLRPGGIVFAMFHSKKPEVFQRYRVMDSSTLQVISAPPVCAAQRVYQNREIQELFGRYRTSKSFVSRDQLRESLFIK
jgi:hypothetical protein